MARRREEREREGARKGEKALSPIVFFTLSISLVSHPSSPKRFWWSWSPQFCQFSHDFKFWFQRDVAALSSSRMICQFTRSFFLTDVLTA